MKNKRNRSIDLVLGKPCPYEAHYNPQKLVPVLRAGQREKLKLISSQLPFDGYDRWTHYEVSWLNGKGKPCIAIAAVIYACDSPFIIESKSMKLYFNSFNHSIFEDETQLKKTIRSDLEKVIQSEVAVSLLPVKKISNQAKRIKFKGYCLDQLDLSFCEYTVNPNFLFTESTSVKTDKVYSDLLKSNCLVTGQPDWGSVHICYSGRKINYEGLLKYIVSFRNHQEFHEHCIERIFVDILTRCKPDHLTVDGRYTRRGGIEINPYRTTETVKKWVLFPGRLDRQ